MSKLIWIASPTGPKQVPAIAILGDFAITEVQRPFAGFTISHIPTGHALLAHDVELSSKVLRKLLKLLANIPRFDFQTMGEHRGAILVALEKAKEAAK